MPCPIRFGPPPRIMIFRLFVRRHALALVFVRRVESTASPQASNSAAHVSTRCRPARMSQLDAATRGRSLPARPSSSASCVRRRSPSASPRGASVRAHRSDASTSRAPAVAISKRCSQEPRSIFVRSKISSTVAPRRTASTIAQGRPGRGDVDLIPEDLLSGVALRQIRRLEAGVCRSRESGSPSGNSP